jgi:hypothetical protein
MRLTNIRCLPAELELTKAYPKIGIILSWGRKLDELGVDVAPKGVLGTLVKAVDDKRYVFLI